MQIRFCNISFQTNPIWTYYSVDEDVDVSIYRYKHILPALEFGDKQFGLDGVFERVQSENILLQFDYDRIKAILDEAFATKAVRSNEVTYLKRKYKTIKRRHANTFTELYMNNLLHLVEHIDSMENIEFLPDLQQTDSSCSSSDMGNLFSVTGVVEKVGKVHVSDIFR